VAEVEVRRLEKLLDGYLDSKVVKKMKRDVEVATDKLNAIIEEWNDIIMEDVRKRPESHEEPVATHRWTVNCG